MNKLRFEHANKLYRDIDLLDKILKTKDHSIDFWEELPLIKHCTSASELKYIIITLLEGKIDKLKEEFEKL
jgi:hypothetical protein